MTSELLLGGILFVAAVVQGAGGLGLGLVASPAIQSVEPGRASVATITLLGLLQNLFMLVTARTAPVWRVAAPVVVASTVGVVLGWATFRGAPATQVALVVAVATLFSVGLLAAGTRLPATPVWGVAAGVLSGFVTVAAGVGGPPVAAYLVQRIASVERYVATLQLVFAFTNLTALVLLPRPQVALWTWVYWLAAVALGTMLGVALRRRVPDSLVRRATLTLIVVTALVALVRAVAAL